MKPTILILGPALGAMSGVTTHVNLLLGSNLVADYEMVHFQVGSEGRDEGRLARWLRLLASPLALFAAILFRHAAVVHINTSLNPRAYWRDVVYLLVAKLAFARVVYQVHGGELPRQFFAGSRLLTRFLHFTLGLPDIVVVLAKCELEAYREFVPNQTVALVPNGIDTRAFDRVPVVKSFPDKPLRLLYLGRVAREKGLYELMQGIRLAVELGVDSRLIVAGGGPELPRLRRYSRALGLGSRVVFSGPVFGKDKVTLLEGCDAFLLPSYAEGLPYALLESMAAGVPVVATPVGAIPDVLVDGTHGLLVPPRDGPAIAHALAALAADRERLSWMSRACRRRIRAAFSIERVASDLAGIYAVLAHRGDAVVERK